MVKQLYKKIIVSHILSALALFICSQADIILIGQFLGVNAVATYGIIMPVNGFFVGVVGLFSVGISAVCSNLVGRGDKEQINRNFSTVATVSFALSLIASFAIFIFKEPLAVLLGAARGTEIFDMSVAYLSGYLIGIPANILMAVLTAYLHIAGKGKLVVSSITVMTVIDVALDVLNGAVFKKGMYGMSLATSVSEIGGLLVVLIYFLQKESMFKFSLKKTDFSQIVKTLVAGSPRAMNQFAYVVGSLVVNRMFAGWGSDASIALATLAVFTSLFSMCYAVGNGIGETAQILAGIFRGENDKENIYESLKMCLKRSIIINSVITALIIIFAKPIVAVFMNGDAEEQRYTVIAVRIGIACIVPMSVTAVFKNYYPSVDKIYIPLLASFFGNFVFFILTYYTMENVAYPYGVWTAQFMADVLTLLLIYALVWLEKRKITFKIKGVALLNDKQFVNDKDIAGFDIRKKEDISSVSEKSGEFCRNLGLSEKLSYYIALCIEEMAVEFAERGFKENRNNLIQVKIVNKDDHCIIRMRDNCKNFDPVNYMKLHENEDGVAHLGIRMVFKMVLSADYMNSLGINCLTLKVKKE